MAKHLPTCPVCDAYDWRSRTHAVIHKYRGREVTLSGMEYSVCGNCGFDLVSPSQQRKNDARVRDVRRVMDGLLSGEEIRSIRTVLGLTQAKASEIFGGGPNAFSKYERGEVVQSFAVDRMLRFISANPEALPDFLGASKGRLAHADKAVARHRSEIVVVSGSETEIKYKSVRFGTRKSFGVVNDDQYLDDAA